MYNGIKSKVKLNTFHIYINDNKSFMIDIHGFTSITNDLEDDLLVYCKILFLFYANDIVLMKFVYTVKSGNIQ